MSVSIYMLHRVLPERPQDPPDVDMTITCDEFDEFLAGKKSERALTLDEWARDKDAEGYILTFDDGYKDNLIHALPIIEKYNVPAIIFITTGFINGQVYPLERALYNGLRDFEKYEKCRHDLKFGTYDQRLQKLKELTASDYFEREDNLFMSWDELKEIAKHPLISLGAHSHTHPNLAKLNPIEQWRELTRPQKILKQYLGFKPDILAYPYGGNSKMTRGLSWLSGYKMALATKEGRADAKSDMFRLPRMNIMEAVK